MQKSISHFRRTFILTKKHIKAVLEITEEEYLEIVEALEGELKVSNSDTIKLILTIEEVEH